MIMKYATMTYNIFLALRPDHNIYVNVLYLFISVKYAWVLDLFSD